KEKKALGYSVQDIRSDELLKNKTANPINSLSGKIAGVNVTQTSGAAGSGAQVILRGGTSLERDNQPLFVVDGIIYDNSTSVNGNSAFDGMVSTASTNSNRVMDINPEDIENMSVLKGPAAAALYGSRAAAGVIIITTKKGQEGTIQVNVGSKFTTGWINRLPEQQNLYKRGYYDTRGVFDDYTTQSWGEKFGAGEKIYDNVSDFFQGSSIWDHNVSVAGGTKNGTFYVSASRFDQMGIIPTTGYDKTTFRINGDQKYGQLTVGANIAYSQANTDKTLTSAGLWDSGGTGTMNSVYRWSRSDDMTHYLNDDDSKYRMFAGRQDLVDDIENPYWIINKNKMSDMTERVTGNINAAFKITDWWDISYRAGIDSYNTSNYNLVYPE
ncbi:TonB-dependent receptor SusC, partial [termite gut metagenome]